METISLSNQILELKKQKPKNKKKLSEIIFARACCSIGIIIFHYFCHSKGNFKLLYLTANSNWGFMFVTCFFCISGSVLYYNYQKINSIKYFYYKRWKSIFPGYYICFIYFFIKNVFKYHKLFYKGHWVKLIFTIFGMDGYLDYRFKSYFLIGEWFLGAIILIYLLYPLLSYLMNINIFIIHFIAISFYPLLDIKKYFVIDASKNLITCIYSFYFGMIGLKFFNFFFKNKIIFIISIFLFIVLCYIRISKFVLIFQIQGFALYIILIHISKYIMLNRFKVLFIKISALSYNIFLFQHIIILDILDVNNPSEWYLHLELLLITIILTIICSKILFLVVNDFINSFFFKKLESLILNNGLNNT